MNESADPEKLVEHFFRHESAGIVALLARAFGFALIDVIEDMVQEALLEALRSWRQRGVPDNPTAWLHRVARNRLIDALRRNRAHAVALDSLAVDLPGHESFAFNDDEIEDSLLRMIFTCCHPSLDRQSQLALTLKVLCGLGDHEVAAGLLISREAAKKRVSRAKRQLQLNRVALEVPASALLNERLDAVHDVLYLMFNEGYSATRGETPLRIDLCEEAARLCHLLCESDTGSPTTRALLALMLFHAARFESRVSAAGQAILLAQQDRSRWDHRMIHVAEFWLRRSADGKDVSRFHLEAGIARLHCRAESLEETDWQGILAHYELLCRSFPSPIYDLNRAIVLGQLDRCREGLALLRRTQDAPALRRYPLLHCAMADLLVRNEEHSAAIEHWRIALELVQSQHERELLERRITAAETKS